MHVQKQSVILQINDHVLRALLTCVYAMRNFEMCENWVSRFNKCTLAAGPLAQRVLNLYTTDAPHIAHIC